jgi:hypothetical protein
MRLLFFFLTVIFLSACGPEAPSDTLVTKDVRYFDLYAPTCERWLEKKFACTEKDCFTAAAVEITGIDTTNPDSIKVFAWAWSQYYQELEGKPYGSLGQLLAVRFLVKASGRQFDILDVFIPDQELSLNKQLEEMAFPEILMDEYFLDQKQEVEIKRIKALSAKAKAKYLMFKEQAYVPTPLDSL